MLATWLAIIGWLLFLTMALIFWSGTRRLSRESLYVAMFGLANLLSDEFHDLQRLCVEEVIAEHKRASTPMNDAFIFRTAQIFTEVATKTCEGELGITPLQVLRKCLTETK